MEFDHDHVNSGRTAVSGVVDFVAADGEAHAIGVILFRAVVYTDAPICDILEPGKWDFIVCDEHNIIGAFADTGNTLGQAAKLSCIRFFSKFLVLWVDKKVPHLLEFAGVHVKDCVEYFDGERATCCISWCEDAGADVVACVYAG